jgi:hypothetical protein
VVITPAQEFKQAHPGVEHAQVTHKIGEEPVKINLLRLDLKKVRLDVHHALDRAIGLETTSSIAKRKGAVAAINAGFFRLDKSEFAGDSAGILMIDFSLLSESHNERAAIFIRNFDNRTSVAFGNPGANAMIEFRNQRSIQADGANRQRKDDELVVYTAEFGEAAPVYASGTTFVVRSNRIRKIQSAIEPSLIPRNGYILSAGKDWSSPDSNLLTLNRRVRSTGILSLNGSANSFGAEDITNGVSILVMSGVRHLTWEQEKASKSFAETRHPRTAVAKLKDGKFLMVTVDGRQPGVSVGMSLQELAEYLLSLGAVEAMNLDGGGSTTMYLDGKVVNTPSDKEGERKVGDVIVVTLRKK